MKGEKIATSRSETGRTPALFHCCCSRSDGNTNDPSPQEEHRRAATRLCADTSGRSSPSQRRVAELESLPYRSIFPYLGRYVFAFLSQRRSVPLVRFPVLLTSHGKYRLAIFLRWEIFRRWVKSWQRSRAEERWGPRTPSPQMLRSPATSRKS